MNYFSVCEGIGAAHAALLPLGYRCVGVSEIDKYCNQLIEEKYEFKNYGDFTKWNKWTGEKEISLIIGGTPCQPFSVIGKRKGADDARADLTREFFRFVRWRAPSWFIWENVPGVLSIDGGGYFRRMLSKIGECGYGVAWRVLDAQFFGVPQRRRRVYVVGCFGDPVRAGKVLFDTETVPVLAGQSTKTKSKDSRHDGDRYENNGRTTGTLTTKNRMTSNMTDMMVVDRMNHHWRVRKLTPLECERLMGFPDGYTAGFSNHQRYKMLGNSFPVPVIRWIGERILREEETLFERKEEI